MIITLDFEPEIEAFLIAWAEMEGVSVDTLLSRIVVKLFSENPNEEPPLIVPRELGHTIAKYCK